MISRGEVGLIVAGVGINEGLVTSNEFSAIVVMVLITTLVTPPILRSLFAQKKKEKPTESSEANELPASANQEKEEAN
jgi:Kef-type K+ transport system membrane component KefB